MNKRVQLLHQWLSGNRNNITFPEIIYHVLKKGHHKVGKSMITQIIEDSNYYKVFYKGLKSPLYWPKTEGLKCLYGFSGEVLDPGHWHYYEIPETTVDKDDIVVDCGAAEGLFSLTVATRSKKVYAVEPLPVFIDSMKLTFSSFTNVEIIPAALSNETRQAVFIDNKITTDENKISLPDAIKINIETIDSLFYSRELPVTYIKADLEGYELNMLEGAKNTIARNLPKIAIATYHVHDHAEKISIFLKDINPNYQIKTKGIEKNTGCPVFLHAWL